MQFFLNENPRLWEYQIENKTYTIKIDDTLEVFLLKKLFKPDLNSTKRIVKLKNIPIEEVLETIINNNYRDYIFYAKDLPDFNIAIQKIEKNKKNI